VEELIILPSARKHQGQGFDDDDIRHADAEALSIQDVPNPFGELSVMVVGYSVDGQMLLEVGVTIDDEGRRFAFHAMKARAKYVR
jgi:hypothetical protein